ncbi:MAG: dihydropteroate synthase [Gammaproteobacteria bacterium]|nr:dihydropteroate synthase [Gammaproteobacteria bacterium]
MSVVHGFTPGIIGERIDPGFRSTRALLDAGDLSGISALAGRQAAAGACCLNISIGARAMQEPQFMAEVVRAAQAGARLPLCFDFQSLEAQRACLNAYDRERAGGALPLVNYVTEPRWELMELARQHAFGVIVMLSERSEGGSAVGNRTAAQMHATARRCVARLTGEYGMARGDIHLDVAVAAVGCDREGLNRMTLEAVRLLGSDPQLAGVHLLGALSNIGQQLPARAADGSDLRLALENAFLTLAVPAGLDRVIGTPWRGYTPLPENHPVLCIYREFLAVEGSAATRLVRRLYRA